MKKVICDKNRENQCNIVTKKVLSDIIEQTYTRSHYPDLPESFLLLKMCPVQAYHSIITLFIPPKNIHFSIFSEQIDLWTEKASGCTCPHDLLDTQSCACCVSNGCQCGHSNPQRCAQCGLEQYCDNSKLFLNYGQDIINFRSF